MDALADLAKRIQALLEEEERHRATRRTRRQQEMADLERRMARFRQVSREWMEGRIVPRLRLLADTLPNALPAACSGTPECATVRLEPTHEYPTEAKLDVWLSQDASAQNVRVTFKVSIIPILGDFDREGTIELDLDKPDVEALDRFLDERVVGFVRDYLKIQQPDSPYQKDRIVKDPVCHMTFPIGEAFAWVEREGQRFYFCAETCRRQFTARPEAYERALESGMGAPYGRDVSRR